MDLTILGEYGLKTALNVGLRLKKLYTSEVDNGIIAAFEFALNDWSKHTSTTSDKVRLSKALEEYIQSSTSYEALDADTQTFIDCFKKRLSEQPAAHNYLMTLRSDMQVKREEQNLLEHYKTQELVQSLIIQMKGFNMDPEHIQVLLKELPLKRGLEGTKLALEEMLVKRRIPSEEVKQLFLEFVRFHLEEIAKRGEEAKQLRGAGDSYLAESLEEINRVLTGESEKSLAAVHEKCQEQAKQNEIRLLKELIEAALIKFSFGEARKFYERLIELAPTMDHHFKYACLLQDLNDFDKARSHYEEVLQELRELSKTNPESYKPHVATVLNNLGSLLSDTNELEQARACYLQALQIYRELAKYNPGVYKPNVAMTLNNLGNLLSSTNELKQARPHLEEAVQIYRELAGYNPDAYKTVLAIILNSMGNLLKNTNEFKQAQTFYEEALQIYRGLSEQNPEAYKSSVATTLNNLGILLKDANELKKSKLLYKEALQIHRELSRHNPEAHNPNLAMTLNNLGNLLSETKEYNQAQACYTEALQIRRELEELHPGVYKSEVAMTLHNMGNLFRSTNELKQAQACYEEALLILRNLMEKYPEAYKPKVAMALNNLTLLYLIVEEQEEAEKAYQEAHDIYQKLASHHPRAYEIKYAKILVLGFDFLGKPKEYIEEAKAILGKYPEHPEARKQLSIIEQLDER